MTPEITIQFIEDQLSKHRDGWAEGATLRELATVFSILRVGNSVPRLVAFTGYEAQFVHDLVHELTRNRALLTGLPSRQFCLMQCAGGGELFDLLTGNSLVIQPRHHKKKELPMSEQCQRNDGCQKENRHKGKCKLTLPDLLTADEPVTPARATSAKDVTPKPSPAIEPTPAKFSIFYEEGENRIALHGVGRERFLSSFSSVQQLLQEVAAQ